MRSGSGARPRGRDSRQMARRRRCAPAQERRHTASCAQQQRHLDRRNAAGDMAASRRVVLIARLPVRGRASAGCQTAVLRIRQRRRRDVEQRRHRRPGRIVEEGPHQLPQRRPARVLWFHGRKVDVAGPVYSRPSRPRSIMISSSLRRWTGWEVRQLRTDLLHRGAPAPIEDLDDLVFPACEMDRGRLGHEAQSALR